jgi:hypothetical protein
MELRPAEHDPVLIPAARPQPQPSEVEALIRVRAAGVTAPPGDLVVHHFVEVASGLDAPYEKVVIAVPA